MLASCTLGDLGPLCREMGCLGIRDTHGKVAWPHSRCVIGDRENAEPPVHEKLVAGLRSYASVRLLTQVASWVGSIYVIRHVGNYALGRYAVALVVFNYLVMAFDGTLLEALIQRPPPT